MSQYQRLENLSKFKSGHVKTLVATDVAGRGIDIPVVRYVVNFNVPKAVDDYIHRSVVIASFFFFLSFPLLLRTGWAARRARAAAVSR